MDSKQRTYKQKSQLMMSSGKNKAWWRFGIYKWGSASMVRNGLFDEALLPKRPEWNLRDSHVEMWHRRWPVWKSWGRSHAWRKAAPTSLWLGQSCRWKEWQKMWPKRQWGPPLVELCGPRWGLCPLFWQKKEAMRRCGAGKWHDLICLQRSTLAEPQQWEARVGAKRWVSRLL